MENGAKKHIPLIDIEFDERSERGTVMPDEKTKKKIFFLSEEQTLRIYSGEVKSMQIIIISKWNGS